MEQINAIKTFDGSDEMMSHTASSVKSTISFNSYTYNSSEDINNAKIKIDYQWSGEPAFKSNDILGFTWSDNFDLDTNKSYLKVTYTNPYYPNAVKTVSYDFDEIALNFGQVVFPLHETKSLGYDLIGVTGLKGTGYVYLSKKEKVKVLKIFGSYGHSTVKITAPSINISNSGISGGISFTGQTNDISHMSASATIK